MPNQLQKRREQSAHAIAELMGQLLRSFASRSFPHSLSQAQWTALRYLGHANESARDVGAFAKFHLTTPSSASQTISALVNKGMVRKRRTADGRRRILDLTAKGRRMLVHDPILDLSERIASLPDRQLYALAEIVQMLVRPTADPDGR